jgi:hypothetical protein
MITHRLAAGAILLTTVIVAPWWVVCSLVLVGLFAFTHYYEALLAGVALDGLYGISGGAVGPRTFLFFAVCTVMLVAVEVAKTRMRLFDKP